jgi:type I site-specific restriction-modification system R (restriction) subunit
MTASIAIYTEAGGKGETALDQAEAVALMLEKYEVCQGLFHGLDWSVWTAGTSHERMLLLPAAQEHILAQQDGKARLLRAVTELSQAFALAVPHAEALRIRDDVGFYQAVRAVLLAFYDALEANDSAVKVLGDDTLRAIARELVETVRRNVTIDWTIRDNVRAQLRVLVKRILRKYGYPPDKQEKATQTVLEQAEVLSEIWPAA